MGWLFAVTLMLTPVAENGGCIECNVIVYELRYQGDVLSDYDTLEECLSAREDIEPQTPPFTSLECLETWVQRYDG